MIEFVEIGPPRYPMVVVNRKNRSGIVTRFTREDFAMSENRFRNPWSLSV